jgi:putative RecB family exonuclease
VAGLHVSVSQLKCFIRCSRQYQLKYVLGIAPAFVPVALAFGSAIHAVLAAYYHAMQAGSTLPLDELQAIFRGAWAEMASGPIPLGINDEPDGDVVDRGLAMLRAFYTRATAQHVEVEAVERSFSVELHDPDSGEVLDERLVGAFDLVVRDAGRPIIIEHKTAARRWTDDQLRYDLQPTAYRMAARLIGLGDVGLRLQVLTKTKSPALHIEEIDRRASDEDDFLRTVLGVLRAIDAGAFYPLRGWACRGCQFAYECQAMR